MATATEPDPFLSITDFDSIVSSHLARIFARERKRANRMNKFIGSDLSYLQSLTTTNGKKLRAYLIYIASNMYGKKKPELSQGIVEVASGMEIFHTAVLIHDDIMDQSPLRRGIPSFHVFESKRFKSDLAGTSLAINFGDTGLFMSAYIISSAKEISEKVRTELIATFSQTAMTLSYGQAYDVISTIKLHAKVTFEEILSLCNLKTGIYTFLLPLQLGTILSGHTLEKSMQQYAYNAGLVFQLTDDYLDIFSDPKMSGKASCNDLRTGKINSIISLTLSYASHKDRAYIIRILKGIDEVNVERVRSIIQNSGTAKQFNKQIQRYIHKAIRALDQSHISVQSKDALSKIVLSLQDRVK